MQWNEHSDRILVTPSRTGTAYDVAIREVLEKEKTGESLFFDLALDDLARAADLINPMSQTQAWSTWSQSYRRNVTSLFSWTSNTTMPPPKE